MLNLQSATCQLYLNKTEKKNNIKVKGSLKSSINNQMQTVGTLTDTSITGEKQQLKEKCDEEKLMKLRGE